MSKEKRELYIWGMALILLITFCLKCLITSGWNGATLNNVQVAKEWADAIRSVGDSFASVFKN